MSYRDLGYNSLGIKTITASPRRSPSETRNFSTPGSIKSTGMFIGEADKVVKADEQGLYIGNDVFADAPFSVDMDGNFVASSGTITGYIALTGTGQSFSGDFNLGDANIQIDGTNNRILINDGTNDIILIGYQLAGF